MAYNSKIITQGTGTYMDLDFSFKKSPVSADVRIKNDVDAIKQQLKNIIFISKGEKPFQPEFDVGIYELLFEPFDIITADEIKDRIETAIFNYVKRIQLISVDVVPSVDQNEINITIRFTLQNITEPQDIDILVTRKR